MVLMARVQVVLGKTKAKVDGIAQLQAFAIGSKTSLAKWVLTKNAVEIKPL
jgi:hypothetical protein